MRLVTFSEHGASSFRVGALVHRDGHGVVVDIGRIDANLPASMRALLQEGDAALARVREALRTATPQVQLPLTDVTLGPVVPDPEKIICIGLNYRDHVRETKMTLPETPTVFAKFRNTLIGTGAAIILPTVTQQVDYEAELAVVIGRRAKGVAVAEALDYVAGYSAQPSMM